MSKDRSYTRLTNGGPAVLVIWSQRRCVRCKRFLSKHQQKYCGACSYKVQKEQDDKSRTKWNKQNRSNMILRSFVYRNADKLNVGDII